MNVCNTCGGKFPLNFSGKKYCKCNATNVVPVNSPVVINKKQYCSKKVNKPQQFTLQEEYRYNRCLCCSHYRISEHEYCNVIREADKSGWLWHKKGISDPNTNCWLSRWNEPITTTKSLPAVTALSPKKHSIERQLYCLNTWKEQGLDIIVINNESAVKELKPLFPQVSDWIVENNESTAYSYPTQLITNMAQVAVKLNTPILLINSDIEAINITPFLNVSDTVQNIGIRWNYTLRHSKAKEFQWGFDAFTFTPNQANMLPKKMPFAIGQAMWDWAVPHILKLQQVQLNVVHGQYLFHKEHDQNWSHDGWRLGWNWLQKNYPSNELKHWRADTFRQSLDPTYVYNQESHQYDLRCTHTENGQQSSNHSTSHPS